VCGWEFAKNLHVVHLVSNREWPPYTNRRYIGEFCASGSLETINTIYAFRLHADSFTAPVTTP
jgi:hypothetical protein